MDLALWEFIEVWAVLAGMEDSKKGMKEWKSWVPGFEVENISEGSPAGAWIPYSSLFLCKELPHSTGHRKSRNI